MLVVYFAEAQVFMGVKAGLSIPDLEGNNEQSRGYTSRQGGYGGVLINFKVNTLLSVQTEVNYIARVAFLSGFPTFGLPDYI